MVWVWTKSPGNPFANIKLALALKALTICCRKVAFTNGSAGANRIYLTRPLFTLLQHATRSNDYNVYKNYAKEINEQTEKHFTIRGLLDFAHHREPIGIEEVEPAENIMKRFATGAMSFGSISHEAHSTMAIAMNRIGGQKQYRRGRRR